MNENENELKIERENIDKIDRLIIKLIDERMNIVKNISKIKQKLKMPIFQPAREEEKLAKVEELSIHKEEMEEIFRTIMKTSKKIQEEEKCKSE